MKRTRTTTEKIVEQVENFESLIRKKKRPEEPTLENAKPLDLKPLRAIELSSSDDHNKDTSELMGILMMRAKNFLDAHAHEENDPVEEIDPFEDELSIKSPFSTPAPKSPLPPPTKKSPLPTSTPKSPTPASPNYTHAYLNYTPATSNGTLSPGTDSNNGFYSSLSVQIENLTHRVYAIDQTIASKFRHSKQAWLTTNTNVDQLRALLHLHEDRFALTMREMSEMRDEIRRLKTNH